MSRDCAHLDATISEPRRSLSAAFPMSSRSIPAVPDKGKPFGIGDQESTPSHRKLLRSEAVVVSVAETSGQ
jgi:hypothetical protein